MSNTNHLILLAGAPGTGKTYTETIIKNSIIGFTTIPLDLIKEHIYDEVGFDNSAEKRELDDIAYLRFYQSIDYLMCKNKAIIADYPFSYLQKDELKKLSQRYQYKIITVRLEADIRTLYERSVKRDLEGPRHLGLKMNHYHLGNSVDVDQVDGLSSFEVFKNRSNERGYQTFSLGELITLDVTDYDKIDYDLFLNHLRHMMGKI
ncbi:kinase [Dellaglioa sp. L3N]